MKKNLLGLLRGEQSQTDIAPSYGVSQQTWSSWEKGRTIPDNKTMLKMELDFGIPMEVIFFKSFNYKMKLKNNDIEDECYTPTELA